MVEILVYRIFDGGDLNNLNPIEDAQSVSNLSRFLDGGETSIIFNKHSLNRSLVSTKLKNILELYSFENGIVSNVDGSFLKFIEGSLAYASTNWLIGNTQNKDKNYFSTYDINSQNKTYIRNPNWVGASSGVDLSSISVWNSSGLNTRAGMAITKRHFNYATHYPISINATMDFLGNDGQVVTKRVVDSQRIFGDLSIGTLDSDLPNNIKIAKVMPSNFEDYLNTSGAKNIAVFGVDKDKRYLLFNLSRFGYSGGDTVDTTNTKNGGRNGTLALNRNKISNFEDYYEGAVGGDSGGSIFMIVNGHPVALSQFYTNAEEGVAIYNHLPAIENYISQTNQKLTYLNLSEFTNYGQ